MERAPNYEDNVTVKKRGVRPELKKRCHSISPIRPRAAAAAFGSKTPERRCRSLSSSVEPSERSIPNTLSKVHGTITQSEMLSPITNAKVEDQSLSKESMASVVEKDSVLPHCLKTKTMRALATKKREFTKLRKIVVSQQNSLLEQFAAVKELEARIGMTSDNATSEIRILSLTGWPAHDLLLLVRDDLEMPLNSEISGVFGPQLLQQLHAQLNPIPEEVLGITTEIISRRLDLLNLLRGKHRTDRSNYVNNLEWKTKNAELDVETDRLDAVVCVLVENLKKKIEYSLKLAKMSWIDRETLVKRIDKMYKENLMVQHKLEESLEKPHEEVNPVPEEISPNFLLVSEELAKEKAAREALKEVVTSAEGMLRVARARISTLERQLKEAKTDLDGTKRKQKDLEQIYRHRETSYDARSKKLLEMSKNGEIAVETLSRQRDALELRVKELREQSETAEKRAETRENEQKLRVELLQAKVAQQEKLKKATDTRVVELEVKIKDLEEQNQALRERSFRLVDTERRRCLEYVPSKEIEPSDRETEIWKELQVTRMAMSRAEEELRQSRADKDSFLNSLSRIAQGEDPDSFKDKMAIELLDREQRIVKLQHVIEEQRDNEKSMEQSMTQYENQLAALRLEVRRLRNYDCYAKEIPNQDLQTELLDLHMQVETLSRERTALVSAAASRALMLERHERSAELFAKMTRARRNLAALLDDRTEPPHMEEVTYAEVSRSLSCVCASAADTWTALRAERARVLQLESAVVSQNMQLQRETMVRTQLERRRAILERQLMFTQASTLPAIEKNPSLVYCYVSNSKSVRNKKY